MCYWILCNISVKAIQICIETWNTPAMECKPTYICNGLGTGLVTNRRHESNGRIYFVFTSRQASMRYWKTMACAILGNQELEIVLV